MERDDIPLHDLLGVGKDPDPGPDPLRAIVARAARRRRKVAVGGMIAALLVGGGLGYAFSNHSSPGSQTSTAAAASSGTGSSGAAAGSAGPSSFAKSATDANLTRLFTRTSGAITIRVFRTNMTSAGAPAVSPGDCPITLPALQIEVSTPQMVGVSLGGFAASGQSQPITGTVGQVMGEPEGDPVAVVTAATGPTVAAVRVVFPGGATDQMAPVDGWAVLAGPEPTGLANRASLGTLTALNAAGQVVSSSTVDQGLKPAVNAPSCVPACPLNPKLVPPGSAPSSASVAPAATSGGSGCTGVACGSVVPGNPPPAALKNLGAGSLACPMLPARGAGGTSGSTGG